jgi:hypothetical protein
MILLQASYLYTFSLLRGVTFEALPLSSYALSPTMLSLLETFLELLLWNIFQCHHFFFLLISSVSWNLHSFKEDFIFVNSQKSFGAKSGVQGGCSISVIDFWSRNCLTESALWTGALLRQRIQSLCQNLGIFYAQLHVTSSIFPHNKLRWLFGLLEWIRSEQYTWYLRK